MKSEEILIKTNLGSIPLEDYREIKAFENGFDSYEDMLKHGISFDLPVSDSIQKISVLLRKGSV